MARSSGNDIGFPLDPTAQFTVGIVLAPPSAASGFMVSLNLQPNRVIPKARSNPPYSEPSRFEWDGEAGEGNRDG